MYFAILILLIAISILGLATGITSISKPSFVIKLQQAFYKKINWLIEPISLEKEIRNTKFMGYLDIVLCVIALVLFFRLIFNRFF